MLPCRVNDKAIGVRPGAAARLYHSGSDQVPAGTVPVLLWVRPGASGHGSLTTLGPTSCMVRPGASGHGSLTMQGSSAKTAVHALAMSLTRPNGVRPGASGHGSRIIMGPTRCQRARFPYYPGSDQLLRPCLPEAYRVSDQVPAGTVPVLLWVRPGASGHGSHIILGPTSCSAPASPRALEEPC